MSRLSFRAALQFAYEQLANHLLPELHYHSYDHTRIEVVTVIKRLSRHEGITGRERQLLITAAAYHDVGWTLVRSTGPEYQEQRRLHEELGCQIASQNLPKFGYLADDIATVVRIIMATKLPTAPKDKLEMVMCDADLASLGYSVATYWRRSFDLRHELEEFNTKFGDKEWYSFQIQFLTNHRYYTESARQIFDQNKRKALLELHNKLSSFS